MSLLSTIFSLAELVGIESRLCGFARLSRAFEELFSSKLRTSALADDKLLGSSARESRFCSLFLILLAASKGAPASWLPLDLLLTPAREIFDMCFLLACLFYDMLLLLALLCRILLPVLPLWALPLAASKVRWMASLA